MPEEAVEDLRFPGDGVRPVAPVVPDPIRSLQNKWFRSHPFGHRRQSPRRNQFLENRCFVLWKPLSLPTLTVIDFANDRAGPGPVQSRLAGGGQFRTLRRVSRRP